MPLTIGQVLRGRYRVDALLGQGGMGAVYRATDLSFGAVVAIKENLILSEQARRQFAREAGLLYRLRHPNLPRVIDHFVEGQGQYLVMDYIHGEDLREVITRMGPAPQAQALQWIGQVLDALEYLHARNILHRDVKPANVKITPQGQAYLVDFGLAKEYDPRQSTTMGARGVTPGYAPPEQYGTSRTDARSDLYSVGATLYTLLTGQVPPDVLECLTRQATLIPARVLNPAISPHVAAAISRAMQPAPDDRFQTEAEFRQALAASGLPAPWAVGGAASTAPAPSAGTLALPGRATARPAGPTTSLRRLVWPGLAGAALLLILFAAGMAALIDGPGPQTPTAPPRTAALSPSPAPTYSVLPTNPPVQTDTPIPTSTPSPTEPPIPTDTPGPTDRPPPTSTPIPTSTPTSKPKPTSTARPSPTHTARPSPTHTVQPACAVQPGWPFDAMGSAPKLGCAVSAPGTIRFSRQYFEGGQLIWRGKMRRIYVLYNAGNTWESYPDTYTEGEPWYLTELDPPPGLRQPIKGFDRVWENNPQVRQKLGWALRDESGLIDGSYEDFENGTALWMTQPGYLASYYLLSNDGAWEQRER